ncbi:MAG: pantetheine-phosphate adenylyltransferase [Porticoccaceae bacterium]|nr:pantetheine-phosphate adenylyltransferase [Porticoccaceae bacterium]
MKTIVYPGTFDPITNGHIDLVERGSKLFDKIIIGIASSQRKSPLFSIDERIELASEALSHVPNVEIIGFDYLLVHFVKDCKADAIMRGLRAVSDFEYEFQLAAMNRRLDSAIETMFLTPSERYTFLSASMVKEIASHGGDVSQFLHPQVNEKLVQRLQN